MYQNPDTKVLIPVSINTPLGFDTDTNRINGQTESEAA